MPIVTGHVAFHKKIKNKTKKGIKVISISSEAEQRLSFFLLLTCTNMKRKKTTIQKNKQCSISLSRRSEMTHGGGRRMSTAVSARVRRGCWRVAVQPFPQWEAEVPFVRFVTGWSEEIRSMAEGDCGGAVGIYHGSLQFRFRFPFLLI